jgi:hypothetical protein
MGLFVLLLIFHVLGWIIFFCSFFTSNSEDRTGLRVSGLCAVFVTGFGLLSIVIAMAFLPY